MVDQRTAAQVKADEAKGVNEQTLRDQNAQVNPATAQGRQLQGDNRNVQERGPLNPNAPGLAGQNQQTGDDRSRGFDRQTHRDSNNPGPDLLNQEDGPITEVDPFSPEGSLISKGEASRRAVKFWKEVGDGMRAHPGKCPTCGRDGVSAGLTNEQARSRRGHRGFAGDGQNQARDLHGNQGQNANQPGNIHGNQVQNPNQPTNAPGQALNPGAGAPGEILPGVPAPVAPKVQR